MSYLNLSIQTEYSLLDSTIKIDELFEKLSTENVSSAVIMDDGVLFGWMDFYFAAKKHDIKPIFGMKIKIISNGKLYSLNLIVKDDIGYKNILKLNKFSYQNSDITPHITFRELLKHKEGLIIVDGYKKSKLYHTVLSEEIENTKNYLAKMAETFVDDYYVAISKGQEQETDSVSAVLNKTCKELGINRVASNEVYYLEQNDSYYLEILHAIKYGSPIDKLSSSTYYNGNYRLLSPSEMAERFDADLLDKTTEIDKKCSFEFNFKEKHLPKYKDYGGVNKLEFFKNVCYRGLHERYNITSTTDEKYKALKERLDFEINTIDKMGYIDYFLIVSDFVKYAKNNGIRVGAGRGSAGGSITSYVMHITDVDPIKYGLIFERFLNPDRVSMPDIDIDFEYTRRSEVINYVTEKYGRDKIASISTFGTLSAKAVIRDVARALGADLKLADKLAKLVPNELHIKLSSALEKSEELKYLYDTDDMSRKIIRIGIKLEGMPRHISTHAAGIVITESDVSELIPTYIQQGVTLTQFNMIYTEKLGFLKMDFLGLTNLSIISDTLALIKEQGKTINLDEFQQNLDNKRAYDMISKGITLGVFQLESDGMREMLKKLKPKNIEDIVVAISLYRPGPMDSIPKYLKNRAKGIYNGYNVEEADILLKNTYGCLVYQEQVMEITRKLAGYSYAKADLIRRAMSKKKFKDIEKERPSFINGCIEKGISKEKANIIFEDMLKFAEYAFNKSHAVGYAYISYQTAYLKANYTSEFFSALFSNYDKKSSIEKFIKEMKLFGTGLLKPSVKKSGVTFMPENSHVRYGLAGIKSVGYAAAEHIVEARKNFVFEKKAQSFIDFISLLDSKKINKKAIHSLILSGAFDVFGLTRASMVLNVEEIQNFNRKNMADKNQITLFDIDDFNENFNNYSFINAGEYDRMYLLETEIELLGTNTFKKIKILWLKMDEIKNSDRDLLNSLKTDASGFKVKIVERDNKVKDYKRKVFLDEEILSKFKSRYGKDNVRLIDEE